MDQFLSGQALSTSNSLDNVCSFPAREILPVTTLHPPPLLWINFYRDQRCLQATVWTKPVHFLLGKSYLWTYPPPFLQMVDFFNSLSARGCKKSHTRIFGVFLVFLLPAVPILLLLLQLVPSARITVHGDLQTVTLL